VKLLTAFRQRRDVVTAERPLTLNELLDRAQIEWHGVKLNQPDWSECSHSIAFTVEAREEKLLFHVIVNAYWQPLDFELPRLDRAGKNLWGRWIDTALDAPHDIVEWEKAEIVPGDTYRAESRSVAILMSGFPVVVLEPKTMEVTR